MILGIDPGTACGWALLDSDGARIGSGTWDLRPRRHEGGGMRYLRLRAYLLEIVTTHPVSAVAYEEVRRHAGTDAAHVYGGIVGMIAAVCEERQVPYTGIPVAEPKRVATGNGRASKGEMVRTAQVRWKLEHVGEDEADALWIAEAMRRRLDF